MTDTPDTEALVAEMREAGEGRAPGAWEATCGSEGWFVNEIEGFQEPIFDGDAEHGDARFIAYAGTNWNTIADTLEAQSKEIDDLNNKFKNAPTYCQLPADAEDGDPCPYGCHPDGVCRAWSIKTPEMGSRSEYEDQRRQLTEAQAEIARLREALGYYADRGGYSDKPIKGKPFQFDAAKCVRDGGGVARAALNKDNTDGEET